MAFQGCHICRDYSILESVEILPQNTREHTHSHTSILSTHSRQHRQMCSPRLLDQTAASECPAVCLHLWPCCSCFPSWLCTSTFWLVQQRKTTSNKKIMIWNSQSCLAVFLLPSFILTASCFVVVYGLTKRKIILQELMFSSRNSTAWVYLLWRICEKNTHATIPLHIYVPHKMLGSFDLQIHTKTSRNMHAHMNRTPAPCSPTF